MVAKVFKALLQIREKCDENRLEVIGKRTRLHIIVETERNASNGLKWTQIILLQTFKIK